MSRAREPNEKSTKGEGEGEGEGELRRVGEREKRRRRGSGGGARECGSRVGDREKRRRRLRPFRLLGGAGKVEQRRRRRLAETSGRSCALGKSEIRRFQKSSKLDVDN